MWVNGTKNRIVSVRAAETLSSYTTPGPHLFDDVDLFIERTRRDPGAAERQRTSLLDIRVHTSLYIYTRVCTLGTLSITTGIFRGDFKGGGDEESEEGE